MKKNGFHYGPSEEEPCGSYEGNSCSEQEASCQGTGHYGSRRRETGRIAIWQPNLNCETKDEIRVRQGSVDVRTVCQRLGEG